MDMMMSGKVRRFAALAAALLLLVSAWVAFAVGPQAAYADSGTTNLMVKVDTAEKMAPDGNVSYSVPMQLVFMADKDGKLSGPSSGNAIQNLSGFPIHVTALKVTKDSKWNVVSSVASETGANLVDLKIGPTADQKDVSTCLNDRTEVGAGTAWNMGYAGSGNDKVELTYAGNVKNVTIDLTTSPTFATVQWYVKAGAAT